jgi:type IV secretory pathway VirB4 component
MEIKNLHINAKNVTFADKIGKVVYNQNLGITKEQFSELIGAIKKLPTDKQTMIEKHFEEAAKAKNEEEKKSICERIKRFLVDNGIPVAQSFTGSAILELAKMFR